MPARVDDLIAYLSASPSPYHAVDEATSRLNAAGFRPLDERAPWTNDLVTGCCYVVRGGALVAWAANDPSPERFGIHVVGAHTDSPNLRVKPKPDAHSAGWRQLGVEVYGGVLANSWLDRDLGLSGRVVTDAGGAGATTHLVRIDRPLARVAQLAIHLDRDVNERGLVLDRQLQLTPLAGIGTQDEGEFRRFISGVVGCTPEEILSWDLMLHDLTAPALLGFDEDLLASGRIDNLFSAWAATTSLVEASAAVAGSIPLIALFDHEEIGSSSTTGAAGPFLEVVLGRIMHALGLDIDEQARALVASSCVSADMAHAVHPNYTDRHEPNHRPVPNAGPVVKVNVSQRYATDATTSAFFHAACARAEVPLQTFVSRNSQPCGSTIGPITATRLGIATVDVGCAMLSMHSARELCGALDADLMVRALTSYFAGPRSFA